MFIVSIIIILVVISFVKFINAFVESINASKKAREVHDIEFDKQLKEFYADYKNAAIVETVANEATEMDGYWIRLLRLKHGFEIRVSEFLISVSECYAVEPEEVYVNFLQLGRNPLTSIQQECFATAIYHTLNTVPWLSVSKPKPSLAKDPKTEQYNHFYSVRISTKENCTVPETFGAESQSLNLTMTPPPELIASSSNVTNNCNEIEKMKS